MKDINAATRAKIRIRGRGSKHLERMKDGSMAEAPTQLTAVVTSFSSDAALFVIAAQQFTNHLFKVIGHYEQWCWKHGMQRLRPCQSLFWFGKMSKGAAAVLGDLPKHWPRQKRLPFPSFLPETTRAGSDAGDEATDCAYDYPVGSKFFPG